MSERDKSPGAGHAGANKGRLDSSTQPYTTEKSPRLAVVNKCADYEPIKARALDLLKNNLSSFSRSFTLEEMVRDRDDHSWALKNSVGVALCQARDALKSKCFKVGLHERATREIVKQLREEARQMPVRHGRPN